jgi:hydroxymethylbilane synthase
VTLLRIGTRGSALALAQVDLTEAALRVACPELRTEREIFITRGDQKLDLNLLTRGEAGGKGLFTRELEDALIEGRIDVAVHSLKDLPGHNPKGLELTAVLERAPTADVLVSKAAGGLDALAQGAHVGTSSVRRARQIAWLRPDLVIGEWRGNVPTRLRKLGERADVSAIVLAEAGLRRLGCALDFGKGTLKFDGGEFHASSLAGRIVPAIGQGAIALQIRADREEVRAVLGRINHPPTMTAIRAERELQRLLSGDCSLPVGVHTELKNDRLLMHGILFSDPVKPPAEADAEGSADEPERVAGELFRKLCPGA